MIRFFILAMLCLSVNLHAQPTEKLYQYHIKKAPAIKLDGVLDDAAWATAQEAKDFFLNRPYDSAFAKNQTIVKLSFDDEYLYFGAIVYQKRSEYTVASLKRDFAGGTSDVLTLNIDTFADALNAFHFALSPLGVQREGLISASSEGGPNIFWDNKWYSAVKNHSDYWVAEMAIPFKTLRYKVGQSENLWRINFGRNCLKCNEISTWRPVPRNFPPSNAAFMGDLIWDVPPPEAGKNISLIPYASGTTGRNIDRDPATLVANEPEKLLAKGLGFDAKVAVTPSLNLDLTVNPDFSQVEVDKQQTNLSRFELFFPERRQFFLENADLFGVFGFPDTRPFFSRRIGIGRNPKTGSNVQVPILAGMRLSGKVNNTVRVGLMNMQTRPMEFDSENAIPSANYSVMTVQKKFWKRSTIGGVFTNKQNVFSGLSEAQISGYQAFNRLGGLELNLNSENGQWESESYYHQSYTSNQKKDAGSGATYFGFHHANADLNLGMMRIGENYRADMGYVPRTGIYQIYRPEMLMWYPKNKRISKYINMVGLASDGSDVFDLTGKRLDSETAIGLFLRSPNNAELGVFKSFGFTHLYYEFDPTNLELNPNPKLNQNIKPLPIGDYRNQYWTLTFESSARNNLQAEFEFNKGGYFNGKAFISEGSLGYRFQPIGSVFIDANYADIKMPSPYNSVSYWLVGPRAELSFSRSVFFSTFFQYNTQTNNTNINSRLQWRFKPVSDLYLVFTNNYFAQDIQGFPVQAWTPKNRALVLKVSYWFNV